jgi:hypothetical protein
MTSTGQAIGAVAGVAMNIAAIKFAAGPIGIKGVTWGGAAGLALLSGVIVMATTLAVVAMLGATSAATVEKRP